MSDLVKCDGCGALTTSTTFLLGGDFCDDCVDFCTVCHKPKQIEYLNDGICIHCESEDNNHRWQQRRLRKGK